MGASATVTSTTGNTTPIAWMGSMVPARQAKPPATQTLPPMRWVAFQLASLSSVHLTRMPIKLFWRNLGI